MDPFDPVVSRPQSIDAEYLDAGTTYLLANNDVVFHTDAYSDLHGLYWPWVDADYARSVQLHISNPQDDAFMPMVTQFYTGYQETIYGAEGMIVTKRIAAPLQTSYDRSILWILECQAEGDRLLRIEVDIDWGEPLTQRIVDGLLVAQENPGSAQGIYAQHNADSTRVFGNPQGRPTSIDIDDEHKAKLVYYVLVNGVVEVPLILTISDVGEQMAWNGFLALRDSGRAFERSDDTWTSELQKGALWTPDPRLNRALRAGRTATISLTQRLRTGMAPSDRDIRRIPLLVDSYDTFDPIQSRNLLAHLRRTAERTDGHLPLELPIHPKIVPVPPGSAVAETNLAYLYALHSHLAHSPDGIELLIDHYDAVRACTETLIRSRSGTDAHAGPIAQALTIATELARRCNVDTDAVRWESEANDALGNLPPSPANSRGDRDQWNLPSTWQLRDNSVWTFVEPWHGVELVGRAAWIGCGLSQHDGTLHIAPSWPDHWLWWALLDFPLADGTASLVWDGNTLHATAPVACDLPVTYYDRIRVLHVDEYDFDLQFEFSSAQESGNIAQRFKPRFLSGP